MINLRSYAHAVLNSWQHSGLLWDIGVASCSFLCKLCHKLILWSNIIFIVVAVQNFIRNTVQLLLYTQDKSYLVILHVSSITDFCVIFSSFSSWKCTQDILDFCCCYYSWLKYPLILFSHTFNFLHQFCVNCFLVGFLNIAA